MPKLNLPSSDSVFEIYGLVSDSDRITALRFSPPENEDGQGEWKRFIAMSDSQFNEIESDANAVRAAIQASEGLLLDCGQCEGSGTCHKDESSGAPGEPTSCPKCSGLRKSLARLKHPALRNAGGGGGPGVQVERARTKPDATADEKSPLCYRTLA